MKQLISYAEEQKKGAFHTLTEIEGERVIVDEARFITGRVGEFVAFLAHRANGEELTFRSYAQNVIDAFQNAMAQEALPAEATFVRRGRMWFVE